ncbi:MAG: hypothetical protein NZ561_03615 [Phycisphaerae bacterium]|nr:hypothetical protein [Phycisphaerae bacterium]MDW8261772.1 hypothetical protein [Phycisphaerales bacterium]
MRLSPITYLLGCLMLTVAAVGFAAAGDFRRRLRLKRLAEEARMHFSPSDRFNLAAAVAERFPVVGVADPKVSDLLYCRREQCQGYVFRFEYTVGVTGPKFRRRVIAGFVESREAGGAAGELVIAPLGPLDTQYRNVISRLRLDAPVSPVPA